MSETADLTAMDTFLAEPRNAIVGGTRSDGRLHLTPNWFLWDGTVFRVSTTKDRVKYELFRKNPRAQFVVDDATGFRYVVVDGTVHIEDDVDAGLEHFHALRRKHGRLEQTAAELREEMVRDGRVLLVMTPDKPQSEWLAKGF